MPASSDWGYDYNRELAVLAENNGFDYALSQVRYMAGYGAEYLEEVEYFGKRVLPLVRELEVQEAAFEPAAAHA